jgi:hypothetical protein
VEVEAELERDEAMEESLAHHAGPLSALPDSFHLQARPPGQFLYGD